MLKALAAIEISASVLLLALAVWPFSGYCSGSVMGLDCESQQIFAALMFGPLGILGLVCAAWSLWKASVVPQYVLLTGILVVMGCYLAHAL